MPVVLPQDSCTWSRQTLLAAIIAASSIFLGGAQAADRPAGARPELDLSADYQSHIRQGRFDRALIERSFARKAAGLSALRILVVPSWFSDTARAADELGLSDFLGRQIESLRSNRIEVELAATDSEGAVAENATIILGQIARSPEPVCIISHSKGGLDALEALVRAEDRLVEKVRCWLALQSPFAGSPLADLAADNWLIRATAAQMLPALGGSAQSLQDLTVRERRRYLRQNAERIAAVLRRIAILSYATTVDELAFESLPAGLGARILAWAAGDSRLRSDGLVPVGSAILPDSHYVIAPGIDHSIAVSGRSTLAPDFDRVLLIKLLLVLALSVPEDPPLKI